MTSNRNYFDAAAAGWDADPGRTALAKAVAAGICGRIELTDKMNVLDYGCGTGLIAALLAEKAASITAADSSEGMLSALSSKISAGKLTNISVMRLDLDVDPAPTERFDLIVTSMAMHHVRDIPKVLRAFHRSLVPGGALCVADLDTEGGLFHSGAAAETVRHNGFDRASFLKMMADAGFRNGNVDTVHTLQKQGADGGPRSFTVFLASGRK